MTTAALPVSGINDAEFIEQQIQARQNAKKVKDWALADKIRNNLKIRAWSWKIYVMARQSGE